MEKQEAIIIFGPPGAGKNAQANLLSEKLNLQHIETSRILENEMQKEHESEFLEIDNKKYYFSAEKELWSSGKLCSSPFVFFLVKKEVQRAVSAGKSLVFSGSPRTIEEAKNLTSFLSTHFRQEDIKTFFLTISVKDSIWRNSHRRVCELMNHSLLWSEETKDLKFCPLDGSLLLNRKIDDPKIIEERFKVFEENTLPVIHWLEKNGFRVIRIDGRPPVAEVYYSILSHLRR